MHLFVRAMICLMFMSAILTARPVVAQESAVIPIRDLNDAHSPIAQSDSTQFSLLKAEIDDLRDQIEQSNRTVFLDDTSRICDIPTANHTGGFFGGASLTFAKPFFKEAFQVATIDVFTGSQQLNGFDYDHESTPRLWLGYANPKGAGIQARYWQFDHEANPRQLASTPTNIVSAQTVFIIFPGVITAAPGDTLSFNAGLKTEYFDLEGTQRIQFGQFTGRLGGGIRYLRLEQTFDAFTQGAVPQRLFMDRVMEGVGPLMSAQVDRPLGILGLSVYGAARGSLIFGSKTMNRTLQDTAGTFPPNIMLDHVDEVTVVGELEIGVQWTWRIGSAEIFVRGNYEGHVLTDAGAPALGFLGFEGFGLTAGLSR